MNNIPTQTNLFSISNLAKYILAPALLLSLASCTKPTTPELTEAQKDEQLQKERLTQTFGKIESNIPNSYSASVAEDFVKSLRNTDQKIYAINPLKNLTIDSITEDDWKIINQLALVEDLPKQPRNLTDLKTQEVEPLFKANMDTSQWYSSFLSPIEWEKVNGKDIPISPYTLFNKKNKEVLVVPVNSSARGSVTTTIFFFQDGRKVKTNSIKTFN